MSTDEATRLRWLADVVDVIDGLGIDVHDTEELGVDADGDRLTAEIVLSAPRPDVLEDAGEELPSGEVVDRVDNYASGTTQGYLSTLKDTDHVEFRDDPDHRNRMLYRAPGVSIDEDTGAEEAEEDVVDEYDSTESDTSESASEADDPTTALEEDGDDPVPDCRRCARCDTAFETNLEYYIHQTEVHDNSYTALNDLEQGEFAEIVEEAEALSDIVDATGFSTERTLRVLGIYGLSDVVGPSGIELSDINDFEFDSQPVDFEDFETPGWLDESSLYTAADSASDVQQMANLLGWGDVQQLREMVEQLDVDVGGEEVVA